MGDPKKIRKKYATPSHPWQKGRIEEENIIIKDYGMKNKKEIWKMRSFLQTAKHQTKNIVALKSEQAEKEKSMLMGKLIKLGLLKENSELDDVLGLELKDILDRRLQTIVKKRGFARTMKQSRQFIVHEHITVKGKKITSPSYVVSVEEEPFVAFAPNSNIANPDHPERGISTKEIKKEANQIKRRPRREEKRGRSGAQR